MIPTRTPYTAVNEAILLYKANHLINDNEPTVAMFTDPNQEVFNQPINKCTE